MKDMWMTNISIIDVYVKDTWMKDIRMKDTHEVGKAGLRFRSKDQTIWDTEQGTRVTGKVYGAPKPCMYP